MNRRPFSLRALSVLPCLLGPLGCASTGESRAATSTVVVPAQPATGELPTDGTTNPAPIADEPSVTYACAMHPRVVLDAPGTCPVCGMELIPRENRRD